MIKFLWHTFKCACNKNYNFKKQGTTRYKKSSTRDTLKSVPRTTF